MKSKPSTAVLAILLCLSLFSCLEKEPPPPEENQAGFPPPAVDIVTVETRSYTETAQLPGRISPVRSARVCARVTGIVLNREFEEGSEVEKGQVLFRIDPAPFQADLAGAEAELARARADLYDATTQFNRYEKLVKTGTVSRQSFDSADANVKKGQAAIQAAKARIKTARLNLGYATVKAPISGRIGRAQVSVGDLVDQSRATIMAEIRQLDPIYADFNQPVSAYLRLKSGLARAGDLPETEARVSLTLAEINATREGRLLFADTRVDEGTGQVSLRALFPNPDGLLLPGMFVRIQTPLAEYPRAVFVPQRAVLRDAGGQARVMVVDSQGRAIAREVTTGAMLDGAWQITRGLEPGERVVSTGADKVRPGMTLAMAETDRPDTAMN